MYLAMYMQLYNKKLRALPNWHTKKTIKTYNFGDLANNRILILPTRKRFVFGWFGFCFELGVKSCFVPLVLSLSPLTLLPGRSNWPDSLLRAFIGVLVFGRLPWSPEKNVSLLMFKNVTFVLSRELCFYLDIQDRKEISNSLFYYFETYHKY